MTNDDSKPAAETQVCRGFCRFGFRHSGFFRISSFVIRHYSYGMVQHFADAALVLLGHGTTLNEDSAVPVYQHSAELRRRKVFADVREAFWKQEPRVTQVLESLRIPPVFVVPLFISE